MKNKNIYMANEAYDYLLNGFTPGEIMSKMRLTSDEWRYLNLTPRFLELLHSGKSVPDSIKLREIEDNLFGLLEGPRNININKRIDALAVRYASFLL